MRFAEALISETPELRGTLVDPTRGSAIQNIVLQTTSPDFNIPSEIRFSVYPDNSVIQSIGDSRNDVQYPSFEDAEEHIRNLLSDGSYSIHSPVEITSNSSPDIYNRPVNSDISQNLRSFINSDDDLGRYPSSIKDELIDEVLNTPMSTDNYREYGKRISAARRYRQRAASIEGSLSLPRTPQVGGESINRKAALRQMFPNNSTSKSVRKSQFMKPSPEELGIKRPASRTPTGRLRATAVRVPEFLDYIQF